MLVLSPRQIPVVHAIYTPSETEIHEARKIVQLAEEAREAGRSYTLRGDQLVSPSREKKARAVLARFAAIQSVEQSLSGSGIQQEA
jgi:citrate lyase subunit beta/citryl-CoA lyase